MAYKNLRNEESSANDAMTQLARVCPLVDIASGTFANWQMMSVRPAVSLPPTMRDGMGYSSPRTFLICMNIL